MRMIRASLILTAEPELWPMCLPTAPSAEANGELCSLIARAVRAASEIDDLQATAPLTGASSVGIGSPPSMYSTPSSSSSWSSGSSYSGGDVLSRSSSSSSCSFGPTPPNSPRGFICASSQRPHLSAPEVDAACLVRFESDLSVHTAAGDGEGPIQLQPVHGRAATPHPRTGSFKVAGAMCAMPSLPITSVMMAPPPLPAIGDSFSISDKVSSSPPTPQHHN